MDAARVCDGLQAIPSGSARSFPGWRWRRGPSGPAQPGRVRRRGRCCGRGAGCGCGRGGYRPAGRHTTGGTRPGPRARWPTRRPAATSTPVVASHSMPSCTVALSTPSGPATVRNGPTAAASSPAPSSPTAPLPARHRTRSGHARRLAGRARQPDQARQRPHPPALLGWPVRGRPGPGIGRQPAGGQASGNRRILTGVAAASRDAVRIAPARFPRIPTSRACGFVRACISFYRGT